MTVADPFVIPQIDLSLADDVVAADLYKALTTAGFANLTNHGMSKSLRQKTFAASKAFFTSPLDAKLECAYQGHKSNTGYIGIGKEAHTGSMAADFKETYDIYVDSSNGFSQPWPSTTVKSGEETPTTTYQEDLAEYFNTMDTLHLKIMRLIEIGLGVSENFLVDRCNERHENLRLLHYPEMDVVPMTNGEPRSRGATHTDYGTITLLIQDDVGGLRVQCRDDKWVYVQPVPDSIIINVGDMLQRWTNGVLKANPHQVVEVESSGKTIPERYSIAFFCNANKGTMLKCLPECVSEDQPAKYEPVNAFDYITMRLSQTISS